MKEVGGSEVTSYGSRPESPSASTVNTANTANTNGTLSSKVRSPEDEECHIVSPWLFEHVYSLDDVALPVSLFFEDYLCLHVRETIDLRNWPLGNAVFQLLAESCSKCQSLKFSGAVNMTIDSFSALRGNLPNLKSLSLKDTGLVVNEKCVKVICSFAALTELDISFCTIDTKAFQVIARSCKYLQSIICQDSKGVDDFCLSQLTQCIQRFRKLQIIDLARTASFSDIGLTSIISAGAKVITSLSLCGCKKLNSLALVGLRSKMSVLHTLNISHIPSFGQSAFEWIGEGCKVLTSLNMSHSPALTDGALINIGSNCHELKRLNISCCPLISDIGIDGFMKNFKGKLQFIDISSNLECTGLTTEYLSTGAEEFIEVKMNGVGNIRNPGLGIFWASAKKLQNFEMGGDLRAASNHRRSVLSHISDIILVECKYSCIVSMKISGAVHVTDIGACALIKKCRGLKHLNLSHCHKISDVTLFALSNYSKELQVLNVSMCVMISNIGVRALCTGCTLLVELQLNGLQRLRDCALAAVPSLRNLEVLSLRSCSYVTDIIMIRIIKSCKYIRALDLSGMDMVTSAVVDAVAMYCPLVSILNCDACDIQPHVFAPIIDEIMPLIQHDPGHCRSVKREKSIIEYNKYVNDLKSKQEYCKVLSRFCKLVRLKNRGRDLVTNKEQAIKRINKVYSEFCRLQRMRLLRRGIVKRRRAAVCIERYFRKYWVKCIVKRRAALFLKECHAFSLLQRVFRGYKSRKATVKKRLKVFYLTTKLRHFAWRALMLYSARKIRAKIIKVQSHMRKFGGRLNYICFLSSIITLQFHHRIKMKKNEKIRMKLIEQQEILSIQNKAADVIITNWLNTQHNKMILSFVTFCSSYVSSEFLEFEWKASRIQKVFRGYWVRKNLKLGKCFVDGQYRGKKYLFSVFALV